MNRQYLSMVLLFLLLLPASAMAALSGQDGLSAQGVSSGQAQSAQVAEGWDAVPADAAAKIQNHLRREVRSFKNTEDGTVSAFTDDGDLKLDADLRAARFTSGKDWFALTLESVGREDAMVEAAAPALHVDGDKLELVRDGMTEWYVNHGANLEHGLVLQDKPEGAGSLRFSFATTGTLTPRQSAKDIAFVGDKTINYSGIKAWDAAGANLTCALSVERGNVVWTVDDSHAQYPVTVDPLIFIEHIFIGESSSTRLGSSVSISGDSILVGSSRYNSYAGAAYLFSKDQGGAGQWGLVNIFEGQVTGAYFGSGVSLDGDHAFIAANKENSDTGAAYIYYKDQGGTDQWGLVKSFSGPTYVTYYGQSLCIDGDHAIVGATGVNDRAGAAYIYSKDEGGADQWGLVKEFGGNSNSDYMGNSVWLSGDLAIVGALQEDTYGTDAGAAYIYSKDEGGVEQWGLLKKLESPAGAGSKFGSGVAIDGDLALVGASREDSDTGAAYIFSRNEGGTDAWGQVKRLSSGVSESLFGQTVALGGDVAVVATTVENSYAGAVYTYARNQDGDDQWGRIRRELGAEPSGEFGTSISVAGNYLAVGSPKIESLKGEVDLYKVVLAAPVASGATADTYKNTPVDVDLAGSISNGFDGLSVDTAPSWGEATVSGSIITYTPNDGFVGDDSFTYVAVNVLGTSAPATVTVSVTAPVITVSPTTLSNAYLGRIYRRELAADGGFTPYTFNTTVASGELPPGLSLDSSGIVSGTPTAVGEYTFTVSGADSADTTFTSAPITLNVIEVTSSPMPEGALMLLLETE